MACPISKVSSPSGPNAWAPREVGCDCLGRVTARRAAAWLSLLEHDLRTPRDFAPGTLQPLRDALSSTAGGQLRHPASDSTCAAVLIQVVVARALSRVPSSACTVLALSCSAIAFLSSLRLGTRAFRTAGSEALHIDSQQGLRRELLHRSPRVSGKSLPLTCPSSPSHPSPYPPHIHVKSGRPFQS